LTQKGTIISVREAFKEISKLNRGDLLEEWVNNNKGFFPEPALEELKFVTRIYSVKHFQYNIDKKKMLHGGPVADPFIIAKAYVNGGKVVTLEENKPHAAKIPNICEHFKVGCINLEEFLKEIGISF
jgi:hypothetical protein